MKNLPKSKKNRAKKSLWMFLKIEKKLEKLENLRKSVENEQKCA